MKIAVIPWEPHAFPEFFVSFLEALSFKNAQLPTPKSWPSSCSHPPMSSLVGSAPSTFLWRSPVPPVNAWPNKSPDAASCQPFFLQKTLGEAVGSLKKNILISKTMADLDCKFIIVNDYRVIHHCSKNIVIKIECTSVRKQLYHYRNILWSHSIPLNHHWSRQQNPLDPIEPPSNHQ